MVLFYHNLWTLIIHFLFHAIIAKGGFMNPIELGKFIAKLRNEKNLTQEELAEKLYIDKRKISRWECGTSTPEFDMLIKLSEILDVSLFELSICKRIENESLTKRVINKFKSAKDFNKYQTRKKIKTIAFIILFIILFITTSYTIKYNDTVEIYRLTSKDDNYYVEGNYFKMKDYNFFYIKHIDILDHNETKYVTPYNDCKFEIYDNNQRVFLITNDENDPNTQMPYFDMMKSIQPDENAKLIVNCPKEKNKINDYSFNIDLVKIYNNKLF